MNRISLIIAFAASALAASSAPLPPSQDPFYVPPSGFGSLPPGTVLRSRTVKASFDNFGPGAVTTYQLLYRTQALDGSALADVTTVFVPPGALTDRFVTFQTAYDSSATICEPSFTYQQGANQSNLISSAEEVLLQMFLQKKYIVSAPDYEGPEAAWSPGHLSGMGVLDSLRAVNNFGSNLGLTTSNPKIVGQGYSGGAIATAWAAALQRSYAPELNLAGWSAGGTPANLTGTAVYLDGSAFSGFVVSSVAGLLKKSAYGAQLQPFINQIATPYGVQALADGDAKCGLDLVAKYPFNSIASYKFQTLGPAIFYQPTIRNILDQNILGVNPIETPVVPMYIYHALNDEIIPSSNASFMVDEWCANGASVDFVTYNMGGHISTELAGFSGALQFAQNAFAGTVPTSGCTSSSSSNQTVSAEAFGAEAEPLRQRLVEILTKVGPNDANVKENSNVLRS